MSLDQLQRTQGHTSSTIIEDAVPTAPIELERLRHVPARPEDSSTSALRQPRNSGGQSNVPRIVQVHQRTDSAPRAQVGGAHTPISSQRAQATIGVLDGPQHQQGQHVSTADATPDVRPIQVPTQPVKSTVGVKTGGNVLTRLFAIETTSLYKLTVTQVDEFDDEEAELKYEKFSAFLRTASNDLSNPENDPLIHFRGRWIEHDQVLLQPPEPDAKPLPYIRFIGPRDENEVRILHASLSKRKFRNQYFPPCRICYVVQQLNSLGSDDDQVTSLRLKPDTLCGGVVAIGAGPDRRIVTIGGVVESIGAYYALTVSHHEHAESSSSVEAFFTNLDINEDDFDYDIDSPLVIDLGEVHTEPEGLEVSEDNDADEASLARFRSSSSSIIGTVQSSGLDWSLLSLKHPSSVLPNLIYESDITAKEIHDGLAEHPRYFSQIASEPIAGFVRVIAGVGAAQTVLMLRKPAHLRHPSGSWLPTWKARLGPTPDAKMKRGDSGSWVVDANSGTVYGHVMAATDEHVYIQPLVEIIRDIQVKQNTYLKLASPFGQMAELAKLYHTERRIHLADRWARRALHPSVLSSSSEPPTTSAILAYIQENQMADIDLILSIIVRTGRHIARGLPTLWDEARDGNLGDPARVLGLLEDLSTISGVDLPTDMVKGKQKQTMHDFGSTTDLANPSSLHVKQPINDTKEAADAKDVSKEIVSEKPAAILESPTLKEKTESSSRDPAPNTVSIGNMVTKTYKWFRRTFTSVEIDVTMVGLQGCGKTSLLRVLSGGEFTIDSIPTVGFNMKRILRNRATIKVWDLGGQPRFRPMWSRYCRGVNNIVFVVDRNDLQTLPIAREELHSLLSHAELAGIPLLVLGNDPGDHPPEGSLTVDELIDELDLKEITNRHVSCYAISAKEETNLEAVMEWLVDMAYS